METTGILIAKSQAGDEEAKKILVEENMGLVHHIVKRYLNRGYETEDLFQIGCIGLMKAIEKFDLNRKLCFSTYAVPLIQGEIRRFMRDDGMIKVSRTLKENHWKIRTAEQKIMQKYHREPTLAELQDETGLAKEDIVMALEAGTEVESIYQSVYQSEGSELYLVDQLEDEEREEKAFNQIFVKEMLSTLPKEEYHLIYMRYFMNMTQVEVAKELHMSQVQISRMEKKILKNLKEKNA